MGFLTLKLEISTNKGGGVKYENKGEGEFIVFINSQMIRLKTLSGCRGKASIQVLRLCVVAVSGAQISIDYFWNLYHTVQWN